MHSSQQRAGYVTLLHDTAKESSAASVCDRSMHVWTVSEGMAAGLGLGPAPWLIMDTHATVTSQGEQDTTFGAYYLLNAKLCGT